MPQQGPAAHCFKGARVQIQALEAGPSPKPALHLLCDLRRAFRLSEMVFFSAKSGNTSPYGFAVSMN